LEVLEKAFQELALKSLLHKSLWLLMTVLVSLEPAQIMEKYKLNNQAIVEAVERVIKRK
jgi:hypothetical protein